MIGVDNIKISRIEKLIKDKNYQSRLFYPEEIAYAYAKENPARHLAGIFCVKESVFKTVGEGVISEIKVLHRENGQPYVETFGKVNEFLKDKKVYVSISYAGDYAYAMCQVE